MAWHCPHCQSSFELKSKWEALAHAQECRNNEWTCVECGETLPDDGSLEADGAILEHAHDCYYD